jgi:hypothetical protein
MCHPIKTVHWPSVGALRNTQGQATSQLQLSKYVPEIFQAISATSLLF